MRRFFGLRHGRAWLSAALLIGALLKPTPQIAAQESSSQPVYVRIDSGWLGLFGHGNEYARFPIQGPHVRLQDPNHVMVREGLGLMISFVEQTELAGSDPLSAHARWEVGYWKEHAARVDSATRCDLAGGRDDVRVTELKLWNDAGKEMIIDLVGLRATDGVFAFGFSPAGASADAVVARFVRSLEIVHRPLSQTEIARISHSLKRSARSVK